MSPSGGRRRFSVDSTHAVTAFEPQFGAPPEQLLELCHFGPLAGLEAGGTRLPGEAAVPVEGHTDGVRKVVTIQRTSKPALLIAVNASWDCHPWPPIRPDAAWGPYAIVHLQALQQHEQAQRPPGRPGERGPPRHVTPRRWAMPSCRVVACAPRPTPAKAEVGVDISKKVLVVHVDVSIPTDTEIYAQGLGTVHAPEPERPRRCDRCPGPEDADIALRPAQAPGFAPIELGLHGVIASGTGSAQFAVGADQGVLASAEPGDRPCW
jgi:hypothetical protein